MIHSGVPAAEDYVHLESNREPTLSLIAISKVLYPEEYDYLSSFPSFNTNKV
jgi:hypothetical protein